MTRTLLVAAGGLAGSVARYWLSGFAQRFTGTAFPLGTLTVNALGSFVLGFIMMLSLERGTPGPAARLFLTVGFCGGFTTMSTFSYETFALLRDGELGFALANVGATIAACFAAVWAGDSVARML